MHLGSAGRADKGLMICLCGFCDSLVSFGVLVLDHTTTYGAGLMIAATANPASVQPMIRSIDIAVA